MAETIAVKISSESIDLPLLMQAHQTLHHGAQISFLGRVRNLNLGRQVKGIEYEAFAPLAEQNFVEFCQEAKKIWGDDLHITIAHRVGYLEIGEISVAIIVSACHRAEAYEASRYIIEELKHRAPIWKKEFYTDGASDWVKGHALCQDRHHATPSWRDSKQQPHSMHTHQADGSQQ